VVKSGPDSTGELLLIYKDSPMVTTIRTGPYSKVNPYVIPIGNLGGSRTSQNVGVSCMVKNSLVY